LAQFNPEINWTTAQVIGPQARISALKNTYDYIRHIRVVAVQQAAEDEVMVMHLGRTEKGIQYLRKTMVAQQMAQATYDKDKVNSEATIPAEYWHHKKVFSEEEAKWFPPKREFDHCIILKANAPKTITAKVYPISEAALKAQNEYIDKALEKGFISPSDSAYGSPMFMVLKKDGTHWFVVNYRKLNEYMEPDITPLPHIQTIIKKMSKMTLFTKFDIQEGYHNIQVVPED
jgi:hypothetical protein